MTLNFPIFPGEAFEKQGYFRIGFGVKPEISHEAMERFSEFLESKAWE